MTRARASGRACANITSLREIDKDSTGQHRMSSEISNETMRLLKDFVERNSHLAGIHWDPRLEPRLLVKPFSKDYDQKKGAAQFFLFVAAISETRLIERAENARSLLIHLHRTLGNRLFETTDPAEFQGKVKNCGFYEELGQERGKIAEILASINIFVKGQTHGDLVKGYSRKLR